MIKRLIFDVDNTLIEWKDEYWNSLKDVFKKLNINYNEDILNGIMLAIDTYEDINVYYNKQKMIEYINQVTGCNFDIKFLNEVLEKFKKCVPSQDEKLIGLLEYLSKKYELVILTNWFKAVQESRLENIGILHFFSNVFAGENFKIKPYEESYNVAMGNRLPQECIMIGDNLKIDIQGAINVGMNAIYINPNAVKNEKTNYIIINDIIELQDML